jgi:hypothetical protein
MTKPYNRYCWAMLMRTLNLKIYFHCSLVFEVRVKGSHHIFRKEGIRELINIQKDGNMVKPYQVKQVRAIFAEYNLIKE